MRDRIFPRTGTGERQLNGSHVQVLRIKKLKGAGIVLVAAKHNHRELATEMGVESHIDPARTTLNRLLRGADDANSIAAHAKALMAAAGVKKLRRDAVRAIEIIVSLAPTSGQNQAEFFETATRWAETYFGVPIISAVVHHDEGAPHLHLLMVPLVAGRMVGSSVVGQYGPMHRDFHEQVGRRFGLVRHGARKRLGAAERGQAMDAMLDVLKAHSGLTEGVLRVLLEPHRADPARLMDVLHLVMPAPAVSKGSFVALMTKPCKPEKCIRCPNL